MPRPMPAVFQSGRDAKASLTTSLTGTNNDLTYTAKTEGTAGNATTVRYVVAGASTPLTVSVTGQAITVNVATNSGSTATSTAAQVRTAVLGSVPAAALVDVENASGNDGTGVVTALAATNLSGGMSSTLGAGSGPWRRTKQGGHGNGFIG